MNARRFGRLAPGYPHRPGRERRWREVLGDAPAPLRPGGPFLARLPIGVQLSYEIDLDMIGEDAFRRLVEQQAHRHRPPADEVAALMRQEGLAIPAEGLIVFEGEGGGN